VRREPVFGKQRGLYAVLVKIQASRRVVRRRCHNHMVEANQVIAGFFNESKGNPRWLIHCSEHGTATPNRESLIHQKVY